MSRYGVPAVELPSIPNVFHCMRLLPWLCGLSVLCPTPVSLVAQAMPDAPSQRVKATLVGTVEDDEGALLPGARVEVVSGGSTAVAFADEDGVFHAYGVTAGAYTLRITASGFVAATLRPMGRLCRRRQSRTRRARSHTRWCWITQASTSMWRIVGTIRSPAGRLVPGRH